jgi:asparagine synthase (glutamine-hydrolysing)
VGRTLPGISWAPAPRPEDYPISDERDTLEYLARTLGVQPVYGDLDVDDLVAERIADRTLRPEVSLRWERAASRAAVERGIGVVLSGWGGDETVAFNGRGFFAELFLRGRWVSMVRELRLRAELGSAPWNVKGKVILPLLPDRLAAPVIQRARAIKIRPLPDCLSPALRRWLGAASYARLNARERPGVRRMQETLIENGHLTERIESWYDHGVDRGIEYRYPLLDRRVVEFALGAPPWFSFRNGWKRHGFRRLAEGLLPDETRWRLRKADPAMVRHTGPLMEPARQRLVDIVREREAEIRHRGFLDYDRFLAGLEIPIGDSRGGPRRAATPGGPAVDAQRATWLAFSTGTMPE